MNPYFLQPYKLTKYFSFQKQRWPRNVTLSYYLSFEDALWDLLPKFGINRGATFLLPNYYCVDVINNIEAHGYKVQTYVADKELRYEEEEIVRRIAETKPEIFVDFYVDGIETSLYDIVREKLPDNVLYLIDMVHSLPIPSKMLLRKVHDNTLILTSYRKVSPLFGSLAIHKKSLEHTEIQNDFIYQVQSILQWTFYIVLLQGAKLFKSVTIAKWAEKVLSLHDNLIGDALLTQALPSIFMKAALHLDVDAVSDAKIMQYGIYQSYLADILKGKPEAVWQPYGTSKNPGMLRGYPLIINVIKARLFIEYCRKNGFLVVSQLDDSEWAIKQKLFYLPLGPHLTVQDVSSVAKIAKEALTFALQYDSITA